jgi:hypothetical protein
VADLNSIRFESGRPLLKEVSADRLNALVAEIKKNRPRGERGITVRQTGEGTYLGLAASFKSESTSTQEYPWDIYVVDSPGVDQYTVKVRPGTINGFLPTNWDSEFVLGAGLWYAKAEITTDGSQQTGVTIIIDDGPPAGQVAQEWGVQSSIEIVFGMFEDGISYRAIPPGNITASPKLWLTTERQTPPAPGELPFTQYFFFR